MADRRTQLADAALAVVAEQGLKGLTHRAVDARAGVALGTTSNYFRNRAALVGAAVDRVEELDSLLLLQGDHRELPTTTAALAEQLAAAVMGLTDTNAPLTRARFVFALDQPETVAAGHERLVSALAQLLERLGLSDPRARAEAVSDYSDGLALHLLTARTGKGVDNAAVAKNIQLLLEG